MTQAAPIDRGMIVEDVIDRYPGTTSVFLRRRMQCVGCPIAPFETVSEVCRIYQQRLDDVLAELNAEAERPAGGR